MQRTTQLSAWLLVLTISVLSLVPASYRPVSPASHGFEHAAIFFATGCVFALGYPGRVWWRWAALIVFAGAIEIAQIWLPTRHARVSDFIVDAAAACAGVAAVWLVMTLKSSANRMDAT